MKLVHVPTSGGVTAIEEWEADNAYAYLPIMWAPKSDGHFGPAVSDAGMIHITLPLGEDEGADPVFAVSISHLVDDFIESVEEGLEGPIAGNEVLNVEALAKELKRLADYLAERLAKTA